MREAITMWKYTRMVVLVALTAAMYAAVLLPFKLLPIIPGFTELRPANVFRSSVRSCSVQPVRGGQPSATSSET